MIKFAKVVMDMFAMILWSFKCVNVNWMPCMWMKRIELHKLFLLASTIKLIICTTMLLQLGSFRVVTKVKAWGGEWVRKMFRNSNKLSPVGHENKSQHSQVVFPLWALEISNVLIFWTKKKIINRFKLGVLWTIKKVSKCKYSKWACIVHFKTWNSSYGQK
jgi:hypothetical protein